MKINIAIAITLLIILCSCSYDAKEKFYERLISKYPVADLRGYVNVEQESRFLNITFNDSIQQLENGTGIIYIGSSSCIWCQKIVPELNHVAIEEDTYILYVDASQSFLKSQYDRIVELLNEHVKDNELTAPTVIAVNNGIIMGYHAGAVEGFSIVDEYSEMNEDQKQELRNIYREMMHSIDY